MTYSLMSNCRERGSMEMHQGRNYQDFLKWRGIFLGHSLIITKWTWGFFSQKFAIRLPPSKRVWHYRTDHKQKQNFTTSKLRDLILLTLLTLKFFIYVLRIAKDRVNCLINNIQLKLNIYNCAVFNIENLFT